MVRIERLVFGNSAQSQRAKSFHGFKIVQISDLHVGPTIGREYTQNVVNIANSLQADLIALTGDFVDGTVDDLRVGIAPIAQLKSYHIFCDRQP